MIGLVIKGSDIKGLLSYLLADHDASGEVRGRVVLLGGPADVDTPEEAARVWAARRLLRPRVMRDVRHAVLRAAPDDRPLSDEEWLAIAERYAAGMGWDLWTAVRHDDHVHIAASRVRSDGTVAPDGWDWRRSEQLVRELEREHGLTAVAASPLLDGGAALSHRRAPQRGEVARAEAGERAALLEIQAAIDRTLTPGIGLVEWAARLAACGVRVLPVVQASGAVTGVSYQHEATGTVLPGGRVGRAYTWRRVCQRGLLYEPGRDAEAARRLARGGGGGGLGAAVERDRREDEPPSRGDTPPSRDAGGAGPGDPLSSRDSRGARQGDPPLARRFRAAARPARVDLSPVGPGEAQTLRDARDLILALGGKVEIRAIPRAGVAAEGQKPAVRIVEAEDFSRFVAFIRWKNQAGCDIYVQPAAEGSRWPGVVLVDDLDEQAIRQVQEEARPVAVVETSPGRYQAWIRVSNNLITAEEARVFARGLAARYGGDIAATGARQPGRLAGTTNTKPQRVLPDGRRPWARLVACDPAAGVSPVAGVLAEEARAAARKAVQAGQAVRQSPPRAEVDPGLYDAAKGLRGRLAARGVGQGDASRLDWAVARALLRRGWRQEEVAAWAEAARRHHHEGWGRRLAEEAARWLREEHAAGAARAAEPEDWTARVRDLLAEEREAAAWERAGVWWDADGGGVMRAGGITPQAARVTLIAWRRLGAHAIEAEPPEWAALLRQEAARMGVPIAVREAHQPPEPPAEEPEPPGLRL